MRVWTALALVSVALGCSDNDKSEDDGGEETTDVGEGEGESEGDSGELDEEPAEVCTEPVDVSCVDQMILDFSLHDDRTSEGDVQTTTDGGDFVSVVDASAGGYDRYTRNAWVYVKFTPDGLEKVEIDDETALESMDWDLSLRRYILRLNGGSSGPSCVGVASFIESTYDDLTSVPDGISYRVDDYYTGDCTLTTDSSGLPGSPSVALGPWWSYDGCVQTSLVPHLVQLADGNIVKLVVEAYYESGQEDCNERGRGGSGSGIFTLRWSYMD